jgi:signal peptidase I
MIRNRLRKRTAFDFIEAFLYAAAVGLIIRMFVLTPYKVEDNDMAPAVLAGDYLFAYDLAFGLPSPFGGKKIGAKKPKRGDVVIIKTAHDSDMNEAKRVWALEGDRLEIKNNILYINEERMNWLPGAIQNYGPIVIPPGLTFVASDTVKSVNAAQGNGLMRESLLVGRVWRVWFSTAWESKAQSFWSTIRWDRLFYRVH